MSLRVLMGLDSSTEPLHWTEAFGTSRMLSPNSLLAFRVTLALAFLASAVKASLEQSRTLGWYFFCYLTNWSLIMEIVYFCLLAYVTYVAQRSTYTATHRCVQPMMIGFTIMHPIAFIVTAGYWGFIMMHGCDDFGCEAVHRFMNYFVHGGDWLLCMLSFITSRVPYYFCNAGWLFIFAAIYVAWSYIHFTLRIGRGFPCQAYVEDECPIYEPLDWNAHSRQHTLMLCILVFTVALPTVTSLYRGVGYVRDIVGPSKRYESLHDNTLEDGQVVEQNK
jgi:hypothetical protein